MYWHRLECSLGRFSLVGTTVQAAEGLPRHLVADEKHTTMAGEKVYLAATAGSGCCLGLALAETAGNDDLAAAYGVFRDEAVLLDPDYRPETVNTDGWPATRAAWRALFKGVTIILCFLHGFLKIRDRAKHLGETFDALRERVWDAYHAPDARTFSQRLRRLREWAEANVTKEVVKEKVCRCAASERSSSVLRPTPAAIGRATSWIGCCAGSTTTCIAASTCTARRVPPVGACGAGR